MKAIFNILSQAVKDFEVFCLNFTKGVSHNISLVRQLIENEGEEPPPKEPAQDTAQTELARRRAELKRKQGAEEEAPKEEEVKSVRSFLWKLVKWNLFYSLLIVLGMNQLLLPVLNWMFGDLLSRNEVLRTFITMVVTICWMTPILFLCKISNTFWMNDLSSLAYKRTMGKPVSTGFTFMISDFVYTIILQVFFFIQVIVSAWVPIRLRNINVLELVLTAVMYSMYAFEYKWMNMGYGVRKRMELIDRNLGYHLGFGFPLALAVLFFEDFWIGIALSSVFFPALILCANNAAEPRDARGRSSYVFYPTDKVMNLLFWGLRKLGVVKTGKYMCGLAGLGVLLWLGLWAAVASWLGLLWDWLPIQTWAHTVWHLWQGGATSASSSSSSSSSS